jgi:hypothetical protein
VVVVEQGRGAGVDHEDDVAAAAAVAAVGTAERLELLPVHRRAAVAAVARGDVQHDLVDERGHGCLIILCSPKLFPRSCSRGSTDRLSTIMQPWFDTRDRVGEATAPQPRLHDRG